MVGGERVGRNEGRGVKKKRVVGEMNVRRGNWRSMIEDLLM